ncbi:MAG: thermitase, partial [Actinomycetota bacterium]|nr:thermitase [Actinomycetota bacterium]
MREYRDLLTGSAVGDSPAVRTTSLLRRAALLAAVLVPLGTGVLPASAAGSSPSGVIVTFADGAHRAGLLDRLPGSRRLVGPRAAAARLDDAQVGALRTQPGVLRVEPDVTFHAFGNVNDTCVTTNCASVQEWAVAKVNAPRAWDYSTGSGVTIGVLDSGVDGNHPDLAGKLVGPEIDDTATASGDGNHGTSVAGYAAANTNNGQGIAGFGWDSRILAIKVLDASGSGLSSWVSQGIYDATDRGAKVINLSLGSDQDSQAVRDAVSYAFGKGVVVVASVGNDGGTTPMYPAAIPGVIGVGASTQSDGLASFSNRGPGLAISAPGVNLPAPVPPDQYANVSGTSFSAPIVSGIAALLLAQGIESPSGIVARLQETGVTMSGGGKRVDAGAALALVRAYGGFGGGVRIAVGDLTGDSGTEIVTGAGRGGGPHVRVFTSGYGDRGGFFAYTSGFSGGVDVAAGNVDGSGVDEIVTGPGPGGGPHVRVFRPDGTPVGGGFMAYNPAFTGGVSVAVGDIDGDG